MISKDLRYEGYTLKWWSVSPKPFTLPLYFDILMFEIPDLIVIEFIGYKNVDASGIM